MAENRKKLQSFKSYVEESYLIEMANAGVIDEAWPIATSAGRLAAKGVGAVVKGVAKGGYNLANWAAKKAIKAARERLTTKGQTERIKRQQKNEKEKAALVKAKAQRAQAKKNQPKKQWWFNK